MNSKLEKIEESIATLEIEVSTEEFEKGLQKAYRKKVSRFNIPGFRKGKAPRPIIERHYGVGVFYEDAMNEVFPGAYEQAVTEHGLQPVSEPKLDIVQLEKGKPFIFKAIVTIKPEITVGDYGEISIEKKEYVVTEEDVDKELKDLLNSNARMVTVENRLAQKDDMVIIDYKGFVDDEQFEGGSAEDQTLVLGSGQFVEGFEDQIIGAKAGDNIEVRVTFPEDYDADRLKGREAVFQVNVKEIKEKELPDLDDEFAKDVSEFDTLKELKEDIKEKLEERAAVRAKQETEDEVLKSVTDKSEVSIPDVMIEKQMDSIVRNFEMQLMYQGIKLKDFLDYKKQSLQDFKDTFRENATEKVKTQLTLEKIAEMEGITETEEELNEEIEKLSKLYNRDNNEGFKDSLGEGELNYIKESIIIRKTIDFLIEKATTK